MNSISRFYNTSERMTSLFVKITNQMITSCKEYVYKDGGSSIWSMDRQILIRKLLECVKLNEAYQRCFHDVKVTFLLLNSRKNCRKLLRKSNLIFQRCIYLVNLTPFANEFKRLSICLTLLTNSHS